MATLRQYFVALNRLYRNLNSAYRQTGRSRLRQLREIAHLYRHAEQFGVDDYFEYRLFADGWNGPVTDVAGWRMSFWLDDRLNPRQWRHQSLNKLIMYRILAEGGIPIPETQAVFAPQIPAGVSLPVITEPAALVQALRTVFRYPMFVKAVFGRSGIGATALAGYDPESDCLLGVDGTRLQMAALIEQLGRKEEDVWPEYGYLFQSLLRAHPRLEPVAGPLISSARMVVLLHDHGPEIIGATWKIIVGNNVNDNFHDGLTGNLLGMLDLDTGRLMRVVSGMGFAQKVLETHPNTGHRFLGVQMPDWDEALAIVGRGARLFPQLRFQHWDIAFTDSGPVALEMNVTGGLHLLQCPSSRGTYDIKLREFVSRYGQTATE